MAVDNWALVDTKEITLVPGTEEVDRWKNVAELTITLVPGTEEVDRWKNVAELTITLMPGTGEIDRWKLVATKLITLSVPTVACSTDDDCPEGYICFNGVCVKVSPPEEAFPWGWLAIGSGAAGVILIASGIAEKRKSRA